MKVVYGTPWIEVEFGQRPEGWCLFTDYDQAVKDTRRASKEGPYDGGYIGPERPLTLYEIPFDSLDDFLKGALTEKGKAFSSNRWEPKFKNGGTRI